MEHSTHDVDRVDLLGNKTLECNKIAFAFFP